MVQLSRVAEGNRGTDALTASYSFVRPVTETLRDCRHVTENCGYTRGPQKRKGSLISKVLNAATVNSRAGALKVAERADGSTDGTVCGTGEKALDASDSLGRSLGK